MSLKERLAAQEAAALEKARQLRARRQQIEARERATSRRQERANDTRRKILVGAAVLARVEQGDSPARPAGYRAGP